MAHVRLELDAQLIHPDAGNANGISDRELEHSFGASIRLARHRSQRRKKKRLPAKHRNVAVRERNNQRSRNANVNHCRKREKNARLRRLNK